MAVFVDAIVLTVCFSLAGIGLYLLWGVTAEAWEESRK